MVNQNIGDEMYHWATELYPVCRSLTGPGVRETLEYIKEIIPALEIHEVASGTQAFDWVVPDEWTVRDAYIADEAGNRIVDFKQHNLHLVGYSEPIDIWVDLEELDKHLHSSPNQPNAIPYITSYYSRQWGFCITHDQRVGLLPGRYHVVIDADLKPGVLNYGEVILPGREEKEVFLSTYVCHPSMANNELSGPVVTTALVRWLMQQKSHRYTYRIIFIPETIGSIVYLSLHATKMKKLTIAGFNLTCVGDDRSYSFMPTRMGDTLADKVAKYVFSSNKVSYTEYSFLERGSDERQYCWPGIELPVVSIMRSKYGSYPEYHTSDDNLDVISPSGLFGALRLHIDCIKILESNCVYRNTNFCEPNLGSRGLYPTISNLDGKKRSRDLLDFMVYVDGSATVLDIALTLRLPVIYLLDLISTLLLNGLIEEVKKGDHS
jgi:aminopeptidase-like protein